MAYVINDACISYGSYAAERSVSTISEKDSQCAIDAGACVSHGIYATTCPAGTISED